MSSRDGVVEVHLRFVKISTLPWSFCLHFSPFSQDSLVVHCAQCRHGKSVSDLRSAPWTLIETALSTLDELKQLSLYGEF